MKALLYFVMFTFVSQTALAQGLLPPDPHSVTKHNTQTVADSSALEQNESNSGFFILDSLTRAVVLGLMVAGLGGSVAEHVSDALSPSSLPKEWAEFQVKLYQSIHPENRYEAIKYALVILQEYDENYKTEYAQQILDKMELAIISERLVPGREYISDYELEGVAYRTTLKYLQDLEYEARLLLDEAKPQDSAYDLYIRVDFAIKLILKYAQNPDSK